MKRYCITLPVRVFFISSLLLALVLGLVLASPAGAVGYYTYYVSSTIGNDSYTLDQAKNPETPWATINYAINQASGGDTIVVQGGTYDPASEGRPLGESTKGLFNVTKGITIKAATGTRPVLDGSGIDGVVKIHPSALEPGNTVVIEGFEITGIPTTGVAITMQGCFNVTPAQVIIRDNWFHGVIAGIDFWGAGAYLPTGWTSAVTNIEITDNKFYELGLAGVQEGCGVMLEDLANWATAGNKHAAVVQGNQFHNIYNGGANFGVGVVIPRADEPHKAANAYIANNTFNDVSLGVAVLDLDSTGVDLDVATLQINNNQLNATVFGIMASDIVNGPVDATGNWWGDASGPGTAVSVGVDYSPWLGAAPGTTPMTWYTNDSIQAAINAAYSGDTINAVTGMYYEKLDLQGKSLTINGAGMADTMIYAAFTSGNAVRNFGDNTTISNLTLSTPQDYGFKVYDVSNVVFTNVRVEDSAKTAFDLNTVTGATLTNVQAVGTVSGFGLMILDSTNVTVNGITTSNNAWGGVSVQAVGAACDNIEFTGAFTASEDVPLMLEKDPPYTYNITNVTVPGQFTHIVYGHRNEDCYKQWFYRESLAEAQTFALGLATATTPSPYSDIAVSDTAEANYYVVEGLLIQDAVDAASSGDTINAAAGTYNLTSPVVVNKSVTLTGNPAAPATVILNAPATGDDREVFQVLSDDVTIQGFTIQGSKDVQKGSSWNSNPGIAVGGDKLMLVNEPDGATEFSFNYWGFAVKDISILNNIITDNSYGIFLFHSQNVLIEGNKIFGNTRDANTWSGKGIAIYTSKDQADPDLVSVGVALPHTHNITINDNEIYANELFGIELNHAEEYHGGDGGPFDVDVKITNNEIYNNGGPMDEVGEAFDYSRGITSNGNETNVTITGNTIYGHVTTAGERFQSSAAGIRIPAAASWTIQGNTIYGNTNGIYAYAGSTDVTINAGIIGPNIIYGNARGILMSDGTVGAINGNKIYDNNVTTWEVNGVAPAGVVNQGAIALDATKNWWGTDSGADIYNMVSDNVIFDPYYSSPAMTTLVSGAPVYNEDQDIGYYSIQAAIDGAEAGDTITVAADTYNESIVIDESITLLAPEGAANTKILGTGSIVVEILSDLDVTIDGFDIDVADSYGVYVNEIGAGFTVTIQNCDINNNWYGISADYVSGTLNILNNTIRDNSECGVDIGVVWDGSVNAIGNVISGNRRGIYVNQIGGSVSIWNNTITQNDEGVYVNKVWEGAELDIIDNIISENWYDDEGDTFGDGIYIDNIVGTPETVNILRNEIRDNGEDGIEIREIYSSTVNIRDNEITGNPWGIYIEYVNGSSLNVTDNSITGPENEEDITFECSGIGIWSIGYAPLTVNIERNTISGYPNGVMTAFISTSTVNIRDNVINGLDSEAEDTAGILVFAAEESALEITGNSINLQAVESVPATGIQIGIFGMPFESGLVECFTVINGNTVTGPGDSYEGDIPGSGIQITDIYEGETWIQDNNLAGNFCGLLFGSVELDSSTSINYAEELYISGNQLARNLIGIMFNTDIESSALTITENNVSENLAGIIFGGEIVGGTEEYLELYRNTISGNYEAGLINSTLTSITAENNFWGTANGGEIAALIEGSVDYDPWHLKEGPQVAAFTDITTTSVVLNWTDPGDIWSDDYYDFRYSTSPIDTPAAWAAATRITGEPRPLDSTKSMIIRGLQEDTTYYFALALGYKNVSSELVTANITTEPTDGPDETPPAAVAGLTPDAGSPSTTRINLAWTAPADGEGYVARYIIKRSSAEITADNWDAATTVFNSLTPKAPGQTENFTVTNLQPNTQYWFAVKSIDNAGNTSAISNIVNRTTAAELPTVTGITEDPAGNHNGAARNVTITGANYAAGNTVVRLVKGADVVTLTNIVVANATTITARVPAGVPVGVYQARVINSNGTSALGGTYTVTAAPIPVPVVTNVSPNLATSGTAANNVKITGENFTGATAVTIGGMSAAITGNTGTRLTVNVPGLPAGEYDVLVTANGKSNGVSAVKYIVTAPVVVDENTTEDTTTSDVVTTSGTIPVQVTLTTDNSETATQNTDTNAEINVVIPPNTTVKDTSGNDYQGEINPPRVVKPDEETHGDVPDDAIVLEMGNPDETITFTQDLTVTVRVEAETLPQIYYLNKTTGKYELAGKAGTIDRVNYVAGGVQLAAEPINGKTLFTIGLLLDHMSTYVASNTDLRPQAPTPPVDDTPWYPAPQDDDDEPVLPEGSTDVRGFVNNEGRFTAAVNIASDDNTLVIDIPAGTIGLTADLEPLDAISMVVATDVPAAPQGSSIIGLPWDLGPDGAVFDPAISITMPYDPAALPDNVAEEDLVVAWYDEANGQWVMLATTVDTVNKTVTASVSHFSVYALMGEVTEVVPDEPVVEPTQPTQTTEPAPDKPTTTPTAPTQTTSAPGQEDEPAASTFAWYWWLVIGIGAVIVIALIVVMIRNRRD